MTKNSRTILIYDSDYINKDLYINKRSNDDFLFCVANERIEEIMFFARNNYIALSVEEVEDFEFNSEDLVFLRVNLDKTKYKDKKIFEKIKKTILYSNQEEKYKNLQYWWKFISPKNRKFVEFKLSDIYGKILSEEWDRKDLREVLIKPVFIKTIKKQPIAKMSHWMGMDYLDALGYSIERIDLEEELIATQLIDREFEEYRCWIFNGNKNKKILNISKYKDFYYKKDTKKEEKVLNFIKDYIFNNENINKFPLIFVVDIFLFKDNMEADIVEFNNYELSGRYIYNDIKSIVDSFKLLSIENENLKMS